MDRTVSTIIPHADFGDPECCGCLLGITRGAEADIICNECLATIRTLPAADLDQALNELELALDAATEMRPHCGAVYLFPGFSVIKAFICSECREGVSVG